MRITNEPIAKAVFGSGVKRKILNFLFSNQERVSERELSRVLGVSHTAVNKAMKELLDLNIVKGQTIGAAMTWELNLKSLVYPHVKACLEASGINILERIMKRLEHDFEIINETMGLRQVFKTDEAIRSSIIRSAYIFGSAAEGTMTPESDIDLLVIIEPQPDKRLNGIMERTLQQILGLKILEETGNKVSFHVYSVKEAEENKPSWLREAISKGKKVFG